MSLLTRLFGISEVTSDKLGDSAETAAKIVEPLADGVEKIETVTEFLEGVADRLEDNDLSSLGDAVTAALPWLETAGDIAGEAIPPIKAALKLIKFFTQETDPRLLGLVAFSLSYQEAVASAAKALEADPRYKAEIHRAVRPRGLRGLLAGEPEKPESFGGFRLETSFSHPLMQRSDAMLHRLAAAAGWPEPLQLRLVESVHARFSSTFRKIISDGRTKEKFDPLFRFLNLDDRVAATFAAVERHIDYQLWRFNEAPILGRSRTVPQPAAPPMQFPFSLRQIYEPPDCGVLRWADIVRMDNDNRTAGKRRSPFHEAEGGRHALLEQVLKRIADDDFKELIVIQGVAGSGKSAFTLHLCVELRKLGLRPVRIRMRHLALERIALVDDMAYAIAQNSGDDIFDGIAGPPRPTAKDFNIGQLLAETVPFRQTRICPHIFIFDGWDEISASASEGFLKHITDTLSAIRRELLTSTGNRVRVILTGRPSVDIAEAQLLSEETQVFTVRPFTSTQLGNFSKALLAQYVRSTPTAVAAGESRLAALMQLDESSAPPGTDDNILRLPLLALLAIGLTLSDEASPQTLGTGRTALYRRLVDITCGHGVSLEDGVPRTAPRIVGENLRKLLRRTAMAMTIRDTENISYVELRHRLRGEAPSGQQIAAAVGDAPLANLLMSFFFYSGSREQGCEFIHKSFREYLFSEAVVEILKECEEKNTDVKRSPYWKEFDDTDVRKPILMRLAPMLAAQWISTDIARHLSALLEWEIDRAYATSHSALTDETPPVTAARWQAIRDTLVGFWDWWAEGVHLRPQPFIREDTGLLDYRQPYAAWLVKVLAPIHLQDGKFPEPIRTTTVDAHLGDALFRLNCLVHFHINRATGWLVRTAPPGTQISQILWEGTAATALPYQTSITDGTKSWTAFAPSTPDQRTHYFEALASRINAAGWRPQGMFPSGVDMSGVDLAGATIPLRAGSVLPLRAAADEPGVVLRYARLENADLNQSNISEGNLTAIAARGLKCVLSHAQGTILRGADLRGADFSFSTMMNADLADALLDGTAFHHTDIRGIDRAELANPPG